MTAGATPVGACAGAQRAVGVAGEHAGVADGEVDLLEAALVALDRLALAEARRRGADGLAARLERVVERVEQRVDRARLGQRGVGAVGVAGLERARDRAPATARARPKTAWAARPTCRIGLRREEHGDGQRHGAADDRLEDPVRRDAVPPIISSSIAETAASEITRSEPLNSTATDIATITSSASCHGAGADQVDEHGGEREAEHDAGDEVQRALAVLAVRGADRDHGRDAREDRLRVRQQQHAQVPRGQRGDARSGRIASEREEQAAVGETEGSHTKYSHCASAACHAS